MVQVGWFSEPKVNLVSTGKVIAEEKVTGTRLTELGKFVGIIAGLWLLGSLHSNVGDKGSAEPEPRVTHTVRITQSPPAPSPSFRTPVKP